MLTENAESKVDDTLFEAIHNDLGSKQNSREIGIYLPNRKWKIYSDTVQRFTFNFDIKNIHQKINSSNCNFKFIENQQQFHCNKTYSKQANKLLYIFSDKYKLL